MTTHPTRRALTAGLVGLAALGSLPVASAHGGGHPPPYPQWLAVAVMLLGVVVVAGCVLLGRREMPRTYALGGVLVGLFVAAAGAVGLVQLSPVESLQASQRPIAQAWYKPLTLAAGSIIAVGSLVVGRLAYPERPRYAALGALLGIWVAYPVLGSYGNPAGYALVFVLPLAVGYVLWRDVRDPLSQVLDDRPSRWFGVGTGVLAGLFFAFSMGMVTFVPEHGFGVPDH